MENRRALAGKKILVTRPKEQSDQLHSMIMGEGGIPLSFPIVKIENAFNSLSISDDLLHCDWIIFTSKNGVDYFFNGMRNSGFSIIDQKVAAVGEKTREALHDWGISNVIVPAKFDAMTLVELLKKHVKKEDRLLFPKGSLAPSYIKDELMGWAEVKELIVYETKSNEDVDWSLIEEADSFFFLSPSAVTFMMSHPLNDKNHILDKPVFCIGPTTKKAALELGFYKVFMPERYTAEDLVKTAASYFQGGN
ncbi:uroporphyrinogen-III synthase [Fictibacillus barbaricus]|uniref:Uroporphyrinogen-III synthase n=1 Tax=Fictibacillus barbaricus TaxID=182136 RepID=A0ABU1U2I3_9BACL|nr:uroporphyrinogen-III synthase [Fictibacillus barbaricus]MDR7073672.1 uroporphyrinogen-III synthase [Fictibacillus barbaricus]